MNELKRLLNRKILLVFMAFIIINVFLYTYQQTRGTGLKELRNSTDQEEQLEYIKHYSDESVRDVKRCESQRESRCVFNQVHLAAGVACDLRADPAHNGDVCGHCNDRSVGLSRNGSCCGEFLYNMVGAWVFNGTWRWVFCAGGS